MALSGRVPGQRWRLPAAGRPGRRLGPGQRGQRLILVPRRQQPGQVLRKARRCATRANRSSNRAAHSSSGPGATGHATAGHATTPRHNPLRAKVNKPRLRVRPPYHRGLLGTHMHDSSATRPGEVNSMIGKWLGALTCFSKSMKPLLKSPAREEDQWPPR